jgi:hypothetical protein
MAHTTAVTASRVGRLPLPADAFLVDAWVWIDIKPVVAGPATCTRASRNVDRTA